MDFDKLDKSQLAVALRIADRAKEMGIDPNLALAIGWQESRFREGAVGPQTPHGQALGPMQVLDSNAKGLGLTRKELEDTNTNIDAGLRLLKENLQRYKGNERAAIVAYNSTLDRANKFVSSNEDINTLLPETQDYLKKVHGMRPVGFTPGENIFGPAASPAELFKQQAKPAESQAAPATPAASGEAAASESSVFGEAAAPPFSPDSTTTPTAPERPNLPGMGTSYKKARSLVANENEDIPSGLIGVGGAGVGALAGAAQSRDLKAASNKVLNAEAKYKAALKVLEDERLKVPAGANTAALEAELAKRMQTAQDLAKQVQTAQQQYDALRGAGQIVYEGTMEGAKDAATTGRQRQGYNIATSQQAKRTDLADDIISQLKRSGSIAADAPNPLATFPDVSATRSGIVVPKAVQAAEDAAMAPKMASTASTLNDLKQQQAAAEAAARQTQGAINAANTQAAKEASKYQSGLSSLQKEATKAGSELNTFQQRAGGTGLGGSTMRALTGKLPGALSGAGAAFNASEALNRYEKGDTSGAVRSAVSAVFDIMSMAPPGTPITAAIKALGITGGLGMAVYDYFASQKKESPAPQAQPQRRASPLASMQRMTKDEYGRYHLT